MKIQLSLSGKDISAAFLLLMILLCSCNKYLDKKQNANLDVPSTVSDLQALLDNAGVLNQKRTPCYCQVSSDEYFFKPQYYGTMNEANQKYYTWRYYFFGTGNDWSAGYYVIYTANQVLDIIKDIPRTSQNLNAWDNVMGSALYFRSYYYLWLLWDFAKAYDPQTSGKDWGIVLRNTSDFNVPSVRATNEESYQQVVEDVKKSISLLPDYAVTVMRPSKAAAYGLLARCYLSMRNYNDALLYADSSLQLNNRLMNYNGDSDIPSGINAAAPFSKLNKEIVFYSDMDAYYGSLYLNSNARIDTSLCAMYDTYDLRRQAFLKPNADGYFQFKGNYGLSGYFSGISTDELYLIRSECEIRANNVESGIKDLNVLLKNRYQTGEYELINTDISQSSALNMVLSERRKELMMRGLRWMDIKRLNKDGANIPIKRLTSEGVYTLLPNANYYALPIPEDIIQMTGIPQNE